MKIPSSKCFARFSAVAFLFLHSLTTLLGQAPNTIAGSTFAMQVSAGTAPFLPSGRYLLVLRGNTDWVRFKVDGESDAFGKYIYQRTAYDMGRAGLGDNVGAIFSYSETNAGTFSIGLDTGPGYQYGFFKEYYASAPASLAQKIIQVTTNGGNFNFGGAGPYKIITSSETTYRVQNAAGNVVHTGTYVYGKTNRSAGVFRFQDGVHAGGFAVLAFETGNKGLSLVRKNSSPSFQLGAFVVSDILPPVFTSQPASRSVAVGTSTTFSTSVTGTGPFSYQWFKDNSLIGGATNASYTLPSVQLWDAGNYRIVVTGDGGTVSSGIATLTPVCGYSLSTNVLQVNFRGGNHFITVNASGTCPWSAGANTNTWIAITSPTAGQGNANLSFFVEANESSSPRTGYLQVAGKTLVVAQGARFVPPNLAGTTLRLDFDDSSEEDGLLLLASGTNQQMRFVAFDTNSLSETMDYSYTVLSSSNALIDFSSGDALLTFTSAKRGFFILTNSLQPDVTLSGSFVMSPTAPDFNGDGRGDLVVQGPAGGFAAWHLVNTNFLNVKLLRDGIAPNSGGRGFGASDFNGDGYSDLVIQDSTGRLLVWFMQGTNRMGGITLRNGVAASGWRAFSVADVNGDGHPDVLFQNNVDRRLSAWLFNGSTFVSGLSIRGGQPAAVGWRAVGAADLNGDAQVDILLQHQTGQISAWFLNGGQFVSVEILRNGVAPAKWKVMGVSDVNEDGSTDLLWQNDSNQVAAWLFENKEFVRALFLRDGKPAGVGWKVVAPR